MSPAQLKKLQELSHAFSEGRATPKQIKQLSLLLAQINCNSDEQLTSINETKFNKQINLLDII